MTNQAAVKELTPEQRARQDFLASDALATGPLPAAPRRDPEAHRALIMGVSLNHNEQRNTYSMLITAISQHTAKDYKYYIPLPKTFVANITVDPNTLSTGTPDPARPGKMLPGTNERETYAIRLQNSDGTGEVQKLRFIAAQNGKTIPKELASQITDIGKWIDVHNVLLTNLPVVMTLKADENPDEPQFANVLRVKGFFNEREVMTNPRALKGYARAWEQK